MDIELKTPTAGSVKHHQVFYVQSGVN